MRSIRFVLVFGLLLLAVPGWGQSASTSPPPNASSNADLLWSSHPVQQPQAVQVVQAAINALGGTEAIQQLQNYVVQAQVLATLSTFGTTGTAVWTVAGTEYREDYPSAQGTKTLSSGHGNAFSTVNGGSATRISPHVLLATFAPALVAPLLLSELQNQNCSILYIGSSKLGAESVTVVQISSQANRTESMVTPQKWYFDSTSNLPVRIEYRLADLKFISRFLAAAVDLSDYQATSGVLFPNQTVRWMSGKQFDSLKVTSVQTNTNIAPSYFDPPGGLQ